MSPVTFPNGPIIMAGNVFLPPDFDVTGSYAALVTVHPGGGVKEQTAGLYAARLAEHGFVTLAFDASYQGESGGDPHHLEDPDARVEDIRAAVDYLQSLDYVDGERIGVWGICAGGGYAVTATMTDHRIKALGTVSAANIGASWRRGWYGTGTDADAVAVLDAAARQRTAEAAGADTAFAAYVPAHVDEDTPHDLAQASEYYLTARAHHPNAENKYVMAKSLPKIIAYDAFHLVEELFTAPVLIVAGSEAGSLWASTELHARVRSDKKLVVVDGATHMDFYDVPKYVDLAVGQAVPFFRTNLARKA
ncbi:alpha/beta hydrolase [Mycobacteroides franklinii]|uniref:Alpha/beta hydrolase n=2 Tax=Mycobacteroides franklinii TaxID=948102 RepID=A0A4R5PE25_9MYCO|nr:alpha/beta hydrolase [Mycobacteroides franklinii]TDH22694.1 alpha/beta hydrolase [Mycobacteroides franklinii]TDZ44354.1 Alpha/beta hydrolase family protein [Mycobacteroides franklinii]TDZ51487.1 Alpha/beta hydrolase family protein [Mycobacteroides franklinii]TDZ57908.1 Alpha/beta hydrolase family protein [Mycobacteroides franklinii]TDZ64849.1 Alpha/beta hydrolase family protein [Mycobacteroides franklinii]